MVWSLVKCNQERKGYYLRLNPKVGSILSAWQEAQLETVSHEISVLPSGEPSFPTPLLRLFSLLQMHTEAFSMWRLTPLCCMSLEYSTPLTTLPLPLTLILKTMKFLESSYEGPGRPMFPLV